MKLCFGYMYQMLTHMMFVLNHYALTAEIGVAIILSSAVYSTHYDCSNILSYSLRFRMYEWLVNTLILFP